MSEFCASIREVCENEGLTKPELIEEYFFASVVPACCTLGCFVEPDGHCEHGEESILLKLNLI